MSQRREISSIVALVAPLTGPARLYARHFPGAIHGAQVISALRYFRQKIGCPVIIAWDRLHAHRANPVQAFVAAHSADYHLEWLPPYAPELNPEEQCNGVVKQEVLNAQPQSVGDLRQQARRSFLRLGRRPTQLESFFRHAGLSVT